MSGRVRANLLLHPADDDDNYDDDADNDDDVKIAGC